MAEFTDEQITEITEAVRSITRSLDESMRADDELNINAVALANDLPFEQVKPGRALVLNHLSGYNATSACTFIRVGYWNGHRYNWLEIQPAPLVNETVSLNTKLRLREGMFAVVRFEGCTLNDDIHAAINGYWTKV